MSRPSVLVLLLLQQLTRAAVVPKRCVVVGAGVGGLYTAARLACAGVAVTVVEQNEQRCAGGRLGTETLEVDGRRYRFETGPSLLLLPHVYRQALADLGVDADQFLRLDQVRPAYAIHFADGLPSPLELGGDDASERALRSAMESVEAGSYAAYRAYLASARANLRSGLPIFIQERLGTEELATLPRFIASALLGGEALLGGLGLEGNLSRCLVAWSRLRLLRDWPLRSHAAQLRDRFKSVRHQQLLSFQDLYVGLSPDEAPAVFSLLQAIELADADDASGEVGVYYPRGGWGAVRAALLHACERAGVSFRYGARAHTIELASGAAKPHVVGVRIAPTGTQSDWGAQGQPPGANSASSAPTASAGTAGDGSASPERASAAELLGADAVVVNADLASAERLLLPAEFCRSEYRERSGGSCGESELGGEIEGEAEGAARGAIGGGAEGFRRGWGYSSSTVSFYFALRRRYPVLRHHNVFLAPPEDDAWGGLFDAKTFGSWGSEPAGGAGGLGASFHFYLHAPTRTDPSAVTHEGDDALMVLVPVPPIDETISAEALEAAEAACVARARRGVVAALEAAGCDGFEASVVAERVRTPVGWRSAYGLAHGAVFGLSHSLDQLSLLRPGRRHPLVDGLHWVGASTRPGNGVPLVLIGAQKAAEEALSDLGVEE